MAAKLPLSVTPLSQRDRRWWTRLLGNSKTTTIGSHGCTLTAVTMLLNFVGYNVDPDYVNETLRKDKLGGFVNTNQIVWAAVARNFPKVKFTGLFNKYDDKKVKAILAKGMPVIIRANGAPIGAPRTDHFFLALGNGKIADPWTGKIENFAKYTAPNGYRVLERA